MTDYEEKGGMYFDKGTPEKVKDVLINCYNNKNRIRIWYGNNETGVTWNEEYGVKGTMGRSCGEIKIPLLISNRRSLGGESILTHCILKVVDIESKEVLYEHENYNNGIWEIKKEDVEDAYTWSVYRDNTLVARFKEGKKAENYMNFMLGIRMCK